MTQYRMLTPKEWPRIQPLVEELGEVPPQEQAEMGLAQAAVAENDAGQIIGVLFLQLAWHMEPMVIDPNERAHVNFKALGSTLDQYIEDTAAGPIEYFVFSPNKKVGAMAKHGGMTQKPWRVWHKEIRPRVKEKVA